MYPLRFKPLFRRYLWGGRQLATILNKDIGDQECAESWEIVDHNEDQSVVQFGPWTGQTLHSLLRKDAEAILGAPLATKISSTSVPNQLRGRFPLLLKFLDAQRDLSVQVHPDDQMGATLDPPDFGKTEAWYVMHAAPGAKIYAGLKDGVSKSAFAESVKAGTCEQLLHCFEPQVGDCVSIEAGTLHAIGAGLLIAEIQQASDTTFRVFDWNRVDANGQSRDLHIEESLAAINFSKGPVNPVDALNTDQPAAKLLVENEKFSMRKWETSTPTKFSDGRPHILAVIRGSARVSGDPSNQPLSKGQSILLPACLESAQLMPQEEVEFLDITIPS